MALTTVNSGGIKDDSIVNADIKSDAAIALSKLASTPAVLTGSTNNTITTVTSANAIQGEANLTFDGSTLNVVNGGAIIGGSTDADVLLRLDHEDNTGKAELQLNAFGTAAISLISNFSGSTYQGVENGSFGLSSAHARDINFVTAGSERFRIGSTGNVTIKDAKQLLFENDAQNANSAILNLGASGASNLAFAAGGAERLRIDSSGRVGIGSTSPVASTALFGGTQNCLLVAGSAAPQVRIASDTANQADLILQAGNSGADAYIANAASNGDLVFSTHNGTSQGTRLRILDDGGICFNSDTAAANALDDYEEGTFTPEIWKGSTQLSLGASGGRYVKVGQLVTVSFYAFANNSTLTAGTSQWQVRFPFSTIGAGPYAFITAGYCNVNGAKPTDDEQARWQSNFNGTDLVLYSSNNTTNWSSLYMEFSGSGTQFLV